jgi:hypothetical protein
MLQQNLKPERDQEDEEVKGYNQKTRSTNKNPYPCKFNL